MAPQEDPQSTNPAQEARQSAYPPSAYYDVPTIDTSRHHGTPPLWHYGILAGTVLAAVALTIPPRRLDLRNGVLGTGVLVGSNQLAHDYTGRSFSRRWLERGRRRREEAEDEEEERQPRNAVEAKKMAQRARQRAKEKAWREERQRRELEAWESGRGYWGLLSDHFVEVWRGLKRKGPDDD
jgi:hypothetical protein